MADIIKRIRDLYSLSRHNNSPEEAASAAAMAADLMFKHRIAEADLAVEERRPPEEVVDEVVATDDGTSKVCLWRSCLASILGDAFGCHCYTWRHGNQYSDDRRVAFHLVGPQSGIQAAQYMFGYLALEVERLCDAAWAVAKAAGHKGSPRTWKNSFRMGAIDTIQNRLEAQKKKQEQDLEAAVEEVRHVGAVAGSSNPSCALAIYRADQARVDAEYKQLSRKLGLRTKSHSYSLQKSAHEQGAQAASNLSLAGKAGLPGSKKRVEG